MQNLGTRFPELANLPTTPCPMGIMAVHHFPSCWDGKNLDSPDHQSHMYITTKDAFRPSGPCPASHPVRMPQVAYETIWDTRKFNDKSLWPEEGSDIVQPFTWSFGDYEGYGTHADYLFGWQDDSLQQAMDHSCMFDACGKDRRGPLDVQPVADMNKCMDTMKRSVDEDIDGCKANPKPFMFLQVVANTNKPLQGPLHFQVSLARGSKTAGNIVTLVYDGKESGE
jgi:hypothetical protein